VLNNCFCFLIAKKETKDNSGEIEKRKEEKVSSDKKYYLYSLKYFIGKHN